MTYITTHEPVVSSANSSTSTLANDAAFTGTSEDCLYYAAVLVTVFADKKSAVNGLSVQWSNDGTNWDILETASVFESVGFSQKFPVRGRYLRVVYTNGNATQTAFRLQTILQTAAHIEQAEIIKAETKTKVEIAEKSVNYLESNQLVVKGTQGVPADFYHNKNNIYSVDVTTQTGLANYQSINMVNEAGFAQTGSGDYFNIYSTGDATTYYVWYNVNGGDTTDPAPGGTGISVSVANGATKETIATSTASAIDAQGDFSSQAVGDTVYITNATVGTCTALGLGTMNVLCQTSLLRAGTAVAAQVWEFVCSAGSAYNINAAGSYLDIESTVPTKYHVWLNVDGTCTDPAPASSTAVEVSINKTSTPSQVATAMAAAIHAIGGAGTIFSSSATNNIVTTTLQTSAACVSPDYTNIAVTSASTVTSSAGVLSITNGAQKLSQSHVVSHATTPVPGGATADIQICAAFGTAHADNEQIVGSGFADSGLFFGYNGTSFGILERKPGVHEVQRFKVTTGSTTQSEVFTFTLEDVIVKITMPFDAGSNIPDTIEGLLIGTTDLDGWSVAPVSGDTSAIDFIRVKPGASNNGNFTVTTSGSAAARYIGKQVSATSVTNNWITQANFSVDSLDGTGPSGMNLVHTNANRYRIMQSGPINRTLFMIFNELEDEWVLVHEIININLSTSLAIGESYAMLCAGVSLLSGASGVNQVTLKVFGGSMHSPVNCKREYASMGTKVVTVVGNVYVCGVIVNPKYNGDGLRNFRSLRAPIFNYASADADPVMIGLNLNGTVTYAQFSQFIPRTPLFSSNYYLAANTITGGEQICRLVSASSDFTRFREQCKDLAIAPGNRVILTVQDTGSVSSGGASVLFEVW